MTKLFSLLFCILTSLHINAQTNTIYTKSFCRCIRPAFVACFPPTIVRQQSSDLVSISLLTKYEKYKIKFIRSIAVARVVCKCKINLQ